RTVEVGLAALQAEHDPLNVREFLCALDPRMRGENLVEERRARARQPDDENRIVPRGPGARARGEELVRADLDLLPRVALDDLWPVAALGALQRVAALVVAPGLGVLAAILVGLAERETQVIAIDRRRPGRRLLGAHARDFLVQEAVCLEVRQTPVGVAEVRPGGGRGAVGLDGLPAAAEGLER